MHCDGTSWQQVAVNGQQGHFDTLHSVTADTSDDAWAVGSYSRRAHTFVRHWDGSSWS